MKSSIGSALLLITLFGCGNAAQTYPLATGNVPSKSYQFESLIGKSKSQILESKYDNKISLSCSLWIQEGRAIDYSLEPIEKDNSLDLGHFKDSILILSNPFLNSDDVIAIKVVEDLKIIPNLYSFSPLGDGHAYDMQNTPVITVKYRLTTRNDLSFSDVVATYDLYENFDTTLYESIRPKENEPDKKLEAVKCRLNAIAKKEYAFEFHKNK